MDEATQTFIRWNIFARELEEILKQHQLRLGHLDDRQDSQGRLLHPEKVRRLQLSLGVPKNLTTLNPEELERIVNYLRLGPDDETRLRMAVLATAVEMMLMDRIDPYSALLAADEVFHVLIDAMKSPHQLMSIAAVRDPGHMISPVPPAASEGDTHFARALMLVDRATLAMHLAHDASMPSERLVQAQMTHERFEEALRALNDVQAPSPATAEWAYWHGEAVRGVKSASQLLAGTEEDEEDA